MQQQETHSPQKYNWYANSDRVIIMQSWIRMVFLGVAETFVSFRFGVDIIQWLLYNFIWWSHGGPQHGKDALFRIEEAEYLFL